MYVPQSDHEQLSSNVAVIVDLLNNSLLITQPPRCCLYVDNNCCQCLLHHMTSECSKPPAAWQAYDSR